MADYAPPPGTAPNQPEGQPEIKFLISDSADDGLLIMRLGHLKKGRAMNDNSAAADNTPGTVTAGERQFAKPNVFKVEAGKHMVPREHRSLYTGSGTVRISKGETVLEVMVKKPAFGWTLLIWLFLHVILTAVSSLLVGKFVPIFGIPNPIFLLVVYMILKVTLCRKRPVQIALTPSACTAHYIEPGHFVVIQTEEGEWIDLESRPEDEAAFTSGLRSCFGESFFVEDDVVGPTGEVSLSSAGPMDDESLMARVKDLLSRMTDLPENEITEATPVNSPVPGCELEPGDLREALGSEFGLYPTDSEVQALKTAGDVVDLVRRTAVASTGEG